MQKIILPNNWRPRDYQLPLWTYMERGGKRAIEIAHRRWGKDDVALHWAAISAMQKKATYWHMLPQYAQARKAIWNAVNPHTGMRRIDEAFPYELRANTNEHEMFIRFVNGSTWQVVGSDSYNSLVGTPPYGLVVSEWALADPAAWAYLAPILEENGGWAMFITTPRGKNHAYGMYKMGLKDERWHAEVQTVKETGFPLERVESARREYHGIFGIDAGDALIEQEYYCSFESAVLGAVYGAAMQRADKDGRIGSVVYDPELPVHAAFDLGRSDATAIWWYQIVANEIRIIEYHEQTGMDPRDIAEALYGRSIEVTARDPRTGRVTAFEFGAITHPHRVGYEYAKINLPHDGAYKLQAAGGRSIYEQLSRDYGLRHIHVQPQATQPQCIAAARAAIDRCWFSDDMEMGMERGLECMRQYQFEWDDDKQCFKKEPLHNWASHGAKAFDVIARTWRNPPEPEKETPPLKGTSQMTIDQIIAERRRKRLNGG